jgi:glycerophosphoryl diester phosphodiesterase
MTEIASHRGGAQVWPENSPTAFRQTARLAVEQVEFDVHPSRDGRLVVHHDATLDRTTSGTGPLCNHDWADLARLTLKGTQAERMLLLEEVIEIFRPTPILLRLEIKPGIGMVRYPGLEAKIMACLADHGMLDRTVITAFPVETLAEVRRQGHPRGLIWLVARPILLLAGGLPTVIEVARRFDVPMLGLHEADLDAAAVATVRGAGLGIGGWAAHEDEAIRRMFALGVDVFTTDRPDRAVAIRAGG